jgi:hypothetical protein
MVNKQVLQSFISKYYLNGLNPQVKWRIKDKTLTVYAGDTGNVCKIVLKEFDFEDADLGIFDTHKLNKLVNITYGDLIFETDKINQLHTKLKISDQSYNLSYTLADVLVLPKPVYYNEPSDFAIKLELSKENLIDLVKGKNALAESDKMLIQTLKNEDGDPICEFVFGDQEGFSDKITYRMMGEISELDLELPFNSEAFKDILHVNKDSEFTTLNVDSKGMIKLNFENDQIVSEYYLVRTE